MCARGEQASKFVLESNEIVMEPINSPQIQEFRKSLESFPIKPLDQQSPCRAPVRFLTAPERAVSKTIMLKFADDVIL